MAEDFFGPQRGVQEHKTDEWNRSMSPEVFYA
jgi:hypothetical protein